MSNRREREPFASISSSSSNFGNRVSSVENDLLKPALRDISESQTVPTAGKPRLSNSTPLKRSLSITTSTSRSRLSGGERTPSHRLSGGIGSSLSRATTPSRTVSRRSGGLEEMQQLACTDAPLPKPSDISGLTAELDTTLEQRSSHTADSRSASAADWHVDVRLCLIIRQLAQHAPTALTSSTRLIALCKHLTRAVAAPRPAVARPALLACLDLFECVPAQEHLRPLAINQKLVQVMVLVAGRAGPAVDALIDQSLFAICAVASHRVVRALAEQACVKGDRFYQNRLFALAGLLTALRHCPGARKVRRKVDGVEVGEPTLKGKLKVEDVAWAMRAVNLPSENPTLRELAVAVVERLVEVAGDAGMLAMATLQADERDAVGQLWREVIGLDTTGQKGKQEAEASNQDQHDGLSAAEAAAEPLVCEDVSVVESSLQAAFASARAPRRVTAISTSLLGTTAAVIPEGGSAASVSSNPSDPPTGADSMHALTATAATIAAAVARTTISPVATSTRAHWRRQSVLPAAARPVVPAALDDDAHADADAESLAEATHTSADVGEVDAGSADALGTSGVADQSTEETDLPPCGTAALLSPMLSPRDSAANTSTPHAKMPPCVGTAALAADVACPPTTRSSRSFSTSSSSSSLRLPTLAPAPVMSDLFAPAPSLLVRAKTLTDSLATTAANAATSTSTGVVPHANVATGRLSTSRSSDAGDASTSRRSASIEPSASRGAFPAFGGYSADTGTLGDGRTTPTTNRRLARTALDADRRAPTLSTQRSGTHSRASASTPGVAPVSPAPRTRVLRPSQQHCLQSPALVPPRASPVIFASAESVVGAFHTLATLGALGAAAGEALQSGRACAGAWSALRRVVERRRKQSEVDMPMLEGSVKRSRGS